jgi:hypothetical protein
MLTILTMPFTRTLFFRPRMRQQLAWIHLVSCVARAKWLKLPAELPIPQTLAPTSYRVESSVEVTFALASMSLVITLSVRIVDGA